MHLKFFLAKNALLHFLQSVCEINNSDKVWKLKLRLLCEENNM